MISPPALQVLARSVCDGNLVRLPPEQLDRKLYVEVNEVLTRLGGAWKSGKVKAHAFAEDPAPLLATVVDTGEMPPKNPMAFFATPPAVVGRMIEMVREPLGRAYAVLEPSAGEGAILEALAGVLLTELVDAVELDPKRAARLRERGWVVDAEDFLSWAPVAGLRYDVILMNPPFTAPGDPLAYIAHVGHAATMLAPGGELVAVTPSGWTFRTDRRSSDFREFVAQHGAWEELPAGAFKESGTGVNCVLVHLRAPGSR